MEHLFKIKLVQEIQERNGYKKQQPKCTLEGYKTKQEKKKDKEIYIPPKKTHI